MPEQILLQGKILGTEEFLLAASAERQSARSAGEDLLAGRSQWITLLCEVLPRALLAELGLAPGRPPPPVPRVRGTSHPASVGVTYRSDFTLAAVRADPSRPSPAVALRKQLGKPVANRFSPDAERPAAAVNFSARPPLRRSSARRSGFRCRILRSRLQDSRSGWTWRVARLAPWFN